MEHIPVLLEETIQYLDPKPGKKYIDCTLGLGGYSSRILSDSSPDGQLLAIEGNESSLALARDRLSEYGDRVKLVLGNFRDIDVIANENSFAPVDGILYDLGLSTYLLEEEEGFAFQKDTALDMRMRSWETNLTAAQIVNSWPEEKLANIIYRYGGEHRSRRIAAEIVQERRKARILTTGQLANIIAKSLGIRDGRIHSATKTFQALRMVVNQEVENLQESLKKAVGLLSSGGRLVVISYHDGEDRVVKTFFKEYFRSSADQPMAGKIITKKPIQPSREEVIRNPRSRSAKMRVAEK